MTMRAWQIKWTALGLAEFQREMLVMLLDRGLRSRQISERLSVIKLNPRQVGNRMRDLAKQRFVQRVQANSGAFWCLTIDGQKVARYISGALK